MDTNYRLTSSSFVFLFYSFEVCVPRGSIVEGIASCCERGRQGRREGEWKEGREEGMNEGECMDRRWRKEKEVIEGEKEEEEESERFSL